jgi:hypothetical protein
MLDVSYAECHRNRVNAVVGDGQSHRVTAHERDVILLRRVFHLEQAKAQHRAGKIKPNDPNFSMVPARFERDVRSAGADIKERRSARQAQRRNRLGTPATIDARAKEMIEEIVSRCDRIEHLCHAIRGFVRRGSH